MSRTLRIVVGVVALVGAAGIGALLRPSSRPATLDAPVAIQFALVKKLIVLPVSVNGTPPRSFVLDTGNKYAVIDIDEARELGLSFGREVTVRGVGSGSSRGAFVKDAAFSIAGFEGFSQPVSLAIPLRQLAPRIGHDFDGILGADFIRQFVVEIDYKARVMRLHDAARFVYSGAGESIPIRLESDHPILRATVTPAGGEPIEGDFKLDIGSDSLTMHAPFVRQHHLPGPDQQTIRAFGQGGAGGTSEGRIGRLSALRIGRFAWSRPITVFSDATAGAFANERIQGNIGAPVFLNFRLFLDYRRGRIILEPNPSFPDAGDRAFSGLAIEAEGADFRTFRVTDVLEQSPASEAGIRKGDVIASVDGRDAASITLSDLLGLFERPAKLELVVKRGDQLVRIALTPRALV